MWLTAAMRFTSATRSALGLRLSKLEEAPCGASLGGAASLACVAREVLAGGSLCWALATRTTARAAIDTGTAKRNKRFLGWAIDMTSLQFVGQWAMGTSN